MATNDFTGSSTVLETEDEVPLGAARLSPCAPKWWGLSEDQNSTSLQLSSTFEAFRARVST